MGIYDTMQQGKALGQATALGNGGSFAQKQPQQNAWQQKMQTRANPVMNNRPAVQSSVMRKPVQPGMATLYGQTPNNAMNPTAGQIPGQMGSRTQIYAKNKAGLGPSVDPVQEYQQSLSSQKGLMTPYDSQQQAQLQAQTQAAQVPYQEPAVDMGSQDPREVMRMKMAQMGQGRPDVMPRPGIGPSSPMDYAGAGMMNPAIQMDENGLEPRRGAR